MAEQLAFFQDEYAKFKTEMRLLNMGQAVDNFERLMQKEYDAPWPQVLIQNWPLCGIEHPLLRDRFRRVVVKLAKKAEECIQLELDGDDQNLPSVDSVAPVFEKLLVGQFKRE